MSAFSGHDPFGPTPSGTDLPCRVCGCTQDRACEQGCTWVPDPTGVGPLCSSCEWTFTARHRANTLLQRAVDECGEDPARAVALATTAKGLLALAAGAPRRFPPAPLDVLTGPLPPDGGED